MNLRIHLIYLIIRSLRDCNSEDYPDYYNCLLGLLKTSLYLVPPEGIVHVFGSLLGYHVEYQDYKCDTIVLHSLRSGFYEPMPSSIYSSISHSFSHSFSFSLHFLFIILIIIYSYRNLGNCLSHLNSIR